MYDLLECTRVIIWQALVPNLMGKRTAIREYLKITPQVRDALEKVPIDQLITRVRELLPIHGQTIYQAAERKFQAGIVSEDILNRFKRQEGIAI